MFRPHVTAGVIPTNDGLTCVFVGSTPERIAAREPELFTTLLEDASPAVASQVLAARPEGRTRRFPGRPGVMRRPWGPGWAIVGAVDTSVTAGEARWMRGYHDVRNRLSNDLFDITDRMATPGWADGDIGGILRSLSAAMADEVTVLAELRPWPQALAPTGVGCR